MAWRLSVPAVLVVAAVTLSQNARAETLFLARAGRPAATIVVPADAGERLKLAAEELQRYVRRICGIKLPIRADGQGVEGAGLYIGRCAPTLDSDLPDKTLNPETYAIRVRAGNVYFTGRYPTPTYFAVVSFIEDALGVRWFAPGEDWEFVPQGTPGELSVAVDEIIKVPETSPRIWSGHGFFESWNRWNLRNKTAPGEIIPRRQFQNNLHKVFPPAKYARTHPEYYPLVSGRRWIPEGDYRFWRPCESNPDVFRLTVEAARKWFDENPWSDSFSLGMDDIAHMCGCPNCRALDSHADSYEKREFSDRHYKFVNAVAREIARTHPEKYIGTLIYSIARNPPETVERLEDNVFGYITEVSARWCEPGRREADQALTREWARRCKHLSRYEYFGLGTFTPRYYPHWMAEQMRLDKSLGFEGMYTELNTFLPHTAPMVWALAKLQWDASLNIDKLLDEFCTKMFGPAAPSLARYFELLEKSWNEWPPTRNDWEHRNIIIQAQAISPRAVDDGLAILGDALKQADSDVIRRRIKTIRAGLQYAGYAIKQYALSEEVLKSQPASAADAAAMLDRAAQIMQLGAEREPFWAAAQDRADLLGESIRGLAGKGYLQIGRVTTLERGATIGGIRLLDWYAEHEPGRLPEVTSRLTATTGSTTELIRGWLWVREHQPPNLLENPGFEKVATATGPASLPAPAGWSTYNSGDRARFAIEPQNGRSGAAARISGAKSSAVFLQPRRVEAGQRYLYLAYVRDDVKPSERCGYLSIRFQTPSGAWHPRSDLEPQIYAVPHPGWQPLALLVKVPEGAGRIVPMLGARQQTEGRAVLFDDAGLYRLPD